VLAFLTALLRPGSRFQDVPCILLGQHYLSHRDLPDLHRGDATRIYLQELAAHDPGDGPTRPAKYGGEGHTDVARWEVAAAPAARARARKDGGLLGAAGAGGGASLEVSLGGGGGLEFPRHAERYTFTLPSLVLGDPQAKVRAGEAFAGANKSGPGASTGGGGAWQGERPFSRLALPRVEFGDLRAPQECPLDFDGLLEVVCEATGLRAELRFRPWRERRVKGEVARLGGEGESTLAGLGQGGGGTRAKITAHWLLGQGANAQAGRRQVAWQQACPHAAPRRPCCACAGEQRVARIEGSWDGQVTVAGVEEEASGATACRHNGQPLRCRSPPPLPRRHATLQPQPAASLPPTPAPSQTLLPLAGVMFDAGDYSPPLPSPPSIDLARPGPRAAPRFWAALLEAAMYCDAGAAAAAGKKAEALAAALPGLLAGALMFEVPEGPK
jgi:hypothetical protein